MGAGSGRNDVCHNSNSTDAAAKLTASGVVKKVNSQIAKAKSFNFVYYSVLLLQTRSSTVRNVQ